MLNLPAGEVVVEAPNGRGARALDAGVHVSFVVVADVDHFVAALQGARERLQADIGGAAVAGHADHRDLALGQLALLDQNLKRRLYARSHRGGVFKRVRESRGCSRPCPDTTK